MPRENSEKKEILSRIPVPKIAKEIIEKTGSISVRTLSRKLKYDKSQMVINEGYNFLENAIVVRPYIQKKYGIEIRLLELLLHLYPKQAFTWNDYTKVPKPYQYKKITYLIESGHAILFSEGKYKSGHLYTLSRQSKIIVTQYYKHLSGEKKIPEDYRMNPINRKKNGVQNSKRMSLIEKMNAMEPSASKKSTFQ